MNRETKKLVKSVVIGGAVLLVLLYLIPWITIFWLVCGLIDISRNKAKNGMMFRRYFTGNGLLTWFLSPFNLFIDLISPHNPGVLALNDLPESHRDEIEDVLDVFREKKDEIIADIDAVYGEGRRGMYVYRWFGKKQIDNVPELSGDYKYVKTIAVSVFSSKEKTTWHYGPHRLSYRVLLNLSPVETDKVFIECQGKRRYWHEDPLYIFDDTLFHRSINDLDARRYVVFMDVARPSHAPAIIDAGLAFVSVVGGRMKKFFYKNWKLLGAGEKTP